MREAQHYLYTLRRHEVPHLVLFIEEGLCVGERAESFLLLHCPHSPFPRTLTPIGRRAAARAVCIRGCVLGVLLCVRTTPQLHSHWLPPSRGGYISVAMDPLLAQSHKPTSGVMNEH